MSTTLAISITAALLVGATAPTAATAQPASTEACAPVAFVPLRGSGELAMSAETSPDASTRLQALSSSGWQGPRLNRLLQAAENEAAVRNISIGSVPVLDVGPDQGYEAVNAFSFATLVGGDADGVPHAGLQAEMQKVLTSASDGADGALVEMQRFRESQPAGCDTRFIVLGYSQGAMAAHLALERDYGSMIAGEMLIGDPLHVGTSTDPTATGLHGAGAHGIGPFIRYQSQFALLEGIDFGRYNHASIDRYSECHASDPFCDYTPLVGDIDATNPTMHLSYGLDPVEAQAEGSWLIDRVAELAPALAADPVAADFDVEFAISGVGDAEEDGKRATAIARSLQVLAWQTNARLHFGWFTYGEVNPATRKTPVVKGSDPVLSSSEFEGQLTVPSLTPGAGQRGILAAVGYATPTSASTGSVAWGENHHRAIIFVDSARPIGANDYSRSNLVDATAIRTLSLLASGHVSDWYAPPTAIYATTNDGDLARQLTTSSTHQANPWAADHELYQGAAFLDAARAIRGAPSSGEEGIFGTERIAQRIAADILAAPRVSVEWNVSKSSLAPIKYTVSGNADRSSLGAAGAPVSVRIQTWTDTGWSKPVYNQSLPGSTSWQTWISDGQHLHVNVRLTDALNHASQWDLDWRPPS